jgi:hypothetical protein
MSPKLVLILYYLLPFAVFGQTVEIPYRPVAETTPFGLVYYPDNNVIVPGTLHFPAADYSRLPVWKETFGQQVYREPLSLTSMIRRSGNKMGASKTGDVVYTGSDDIFAYSHYGRTGKLIWRTSAIANNMVATRWSLANFNIFRRSSLPSISDQLK